MVKHQATARPIDVLCIPEYKVRVPFFSEIASEKFRGRFTSQS